MTAYTSSGGPTIVFMGRGYRCLQAAAGDFRAMFARGNGGSSQSRPPRKPNKPRAAEHRAELVIIGGLRRQERVVLIQRQEEPFKGKWALPSGLPEDGEELLAAAQRSLRGTGVEDVKLSELGVYDDDDRDPSTAAVSTAYLARLLLTVPLKNGDKQVRWFKVADLPEMAYDHAQIIEDAMAALDRD